MLCCEDTCAATCGDANSSARSGALAVGLPLPAAGGPGCADAADGNNPAPAGASCGPAGCGCAPAASAELAVAGAAAAPAAAACCCWCCCGCCCCISCCGTAASAAPPTLAPEEKCGCGGAVAVEGARAPAPSLCSAPPLLFGGCAVRAPGGAATPLPCGGKLCALDAENEGWPALKLLPGSAGGPPAGHVNAPPAGTGLGAAM